MKKKNHAIIWVMGKTDQHHQESRPGRSILETKVFFTTLDYCELPKSPTEYFCPCIRQLEEEWNNICEAAENHLSNMVRD
jgi:putative NADPH-quinone reductase